MTASISLGGFEDCWFICDRLAIMHALNNLSIYLGRSQLGVS
ncbi:hypothetical protein [uncultured Nostoc sp.]